MVLVKCCDISNELRPLEVAEPWLDCLLEEYFNQVARLYTRNQHWMGRDDGVPAEFAKISRGWEVMLRSSRDDGNKCRETPCRGDWKKNLRTTAGMYTVPLFNFSSCSLVHSS